jgi:hypothetical protein
MAADPAASEWAMKLGVDFCGQAVGQDSAKVAQIAAGISGLTLEDAGSLEGLDGQFRGKLTIALRIDGPTKLQMGSLVRKTDTPNLVFLREDGQACYAMVSNARDAARLFKERMARVDSQWSPMQSPDPAAEMWKRAGEGGDILMAMRANPDGVAEILVLTDARAHVAVITDLQRFSEATAKPCVAGALSGTRAGPEQFAAFFEPSKAKKKKKDKEDSSLLGKPPFEGVSLMFSDKHGGCMALVENGRSFSKIQVAKELGEAFAAISGKGNTTEVALTQTKGSVSQAWHFTDAATGKSVRYTITAFGGGMVLLEIGPE